MVTNTTVSGQNTSKRCCSHCDSVHTSTSDKTSSKNRAPHHRSHRQNPPTLNSLWCHCQDINNAACTTSRPSDTTRSPTNINTCMKPDTTSCTFHQQVSHLTTHNTVSSLENQFSYRHHNRWTYSFHTTFQVITSPGSKPLHMKVNPGAECSSIPLSHLHKAFSKHFIKSGAQKKSALRPMWMTWSAHDGTCQKFLGYIVLDIQHKTLPPNPTMQVLHF